MPLEQDAGQPLDADPEDKPEETCLQNRTSSQQIGEQWCWAACLESALAGNGVTRSQGEIVEKAWSCPSEGCASDGLDDLQDAGCDLAIGEQEVVPIWCTEGFPELEGPLAVPQAPGPVVEAELRNQRPVMVWIGGSHVVLIQCYRQTSGGEEVYVMDPQWNVTDRWRSLDVYSRIWAGWWTGMRFRPGGTCA